jgi:hypothetical protein
MSTQGRHGFEYNQKIDNEKKNQYTILPLSQNKLLKLLNFLLSNVEQVTLGQGEVQEIKHAGYTVWRTRIILIQINVIKSFSD